MNEEYIINEEEWGSLPGWVENHLIKAGRVNAPGDRAFDAKKPLCPVCKEDAKLEIKPKKEIPTQPNVLYIQRKIFI